MGYFIQPIIIITTFSVLNCRIQLPPFTFTQTQTAAERQMIGEDKNIEPNGWLISSIKTSSSGSESWKIESPDELGGGTGYKEYYMVLQTLAYLVPEVKRLKRSGILGENLEGNLDYNPTFDWEKNSLDIDKKEYKNRIDQILKLVNENRKIIYNKRINLEALKYKNITGLEAIRNKELEEFKERQKLIYYNSVQVGEFYEISKNQWVKK